MESHLSGVKTAGHIVKAFRTSPSEPVNPEFSGTFVRLRPSVVAAERCTHDLEESSVARCGRSERCGHGQRHCCGRDNLGGGDTDPHSAVPVKPSHSVMIFQYPAGFGAELAPNPASPHASVSTVR